LHKGRINQDVAAAAALLFVVLTALWIGSDGAVLPPTLDAHMRQTTAVGVWDSFEFGGRPHIAAPQTFLYPPLLQAWASDQWLTLVAYVAHVWLGAFAVYLVVRRFNVHAVVALAVGVGYMLAVPLAVPAPRVSAEILFRAAWLPLLVAAIVNVESGISRTRVVVIGVLIAVAGSPRTQAYGLLTLVAAYVFTAARASDQRARVARAGLVAALLIIAIGAPASFPAIRLWSSARRSGGLMASEPFNGSWRSDAARGVAMNPELAEALRTLRPARVLSSCADIVDAVHLRSLGVRSVGGYGGVFPADYATFVNLTRQETPAAALPYVGMTRSSETRLDLLQFLDAEYQVTCEPAQGELVANIDTVRIYRTPTLGPAIWTCYPNRVGRKAAEYRLTTRRYDKTLSLRNPGPKINVRWAPDVDDAAREAAEARFHLLPEGQPDGRTRRYELLDPSRENVEAMLTNAAVEDTAGLNRETLVFDRVPEPVFDEPATEWLIGLEPCNEFRRATLVKQTDEGQTIVDVDAPAEGVVLFPETYYRSRTALVDDKPASVMRVNLTFTAVPVGAGHHRVELDAQPDTRRMDWAISAIGVLMLAAPIWRRRNRD